MSRWSMEEFGKALVVEPYVPTVVIGAGALNYAGSAAQKEEHLNAIAGGRARHRLRASRAEEPLGAERCCARSAKKDGAGYVLNGHKAVVLGAPQADHLLVTARTGGGQRDAKGVSLFLVPKNAEGRHHARLSHHGRHARARKCISRTSRSAPKHLIGAADGGACR